MEDETVESASKSIPAIVSKVTYTRPAHCKVLRCLWM